MRSFHSVTPLAAMMITVAACADDPAPLPLEAERFEVPVAFSSVPDEVGLHQTHMIGDNEVPANASRAQGQATFQLSADGSAIHYTLIVANVQNVTQSHIHRAVAGTNGPIVAWLYPSAPPLQLIPGRSQGVLAEGTITAANLVGPLAGMPFDSLVSAIRGGRAYVNVHTTQFPPGEIRGQIQ